VQALIQHNRIVPTTAKIVVIFWYSENAARYQFGVYFYKNNSVKGQNDDR
jgi:hypothetical protein